MKNLGEINNNIQAKIITIDDYKIRDILEIKGIHPGQNVLKINDAPFNGGVAIQIGYRIVAIPKVFLKNIIIKEY